MRLEELVSKNYKLLSETELLVWEFINKNPQLCEDICIDELAQMIHVSRTTVLRFAKHLGLSGFSELKVLLKLDNKTQQASHRGEEMIANSFNNYLQKLENEDFSEVIEALQQANNIYAYGTGLLQKNVVNEIKRSFLYANKIVDTIESLYDYECGSSLMQPNDLMIIVTYSGNDPQLVHYVKKLKLQEVKIMVISALKQNELSKYADYMLNVDMDNMANAIGPRYDRVLNYFVLIDFLLVKLINKEKK